MHLWSNIHIWIELMKSIYDHMILKILNISTIFLRNRSSKQNINFIQQLKEIQSKLIVIDVA